MSMTSDSKCDLLLHQVHVIRLFAQPLNLLVEQGYEWDADDIPNGLTNMWMICFTYWHLTGSRDLLENLPSDLVELDKLRRDAIDLDDDSVWTDKALETHQIWKDMRSKARDILLTRELSVDPPDSRTSYWYQILPEELY